MEQTLIESKWNVVNNILNRQKKQKMEEMNKHPSINIKIEK